MPANRQTNSLVGRNSPLDRVRSRARTAITQTPTRVTKSNSRSRSGRGSRRPDVRPLSRREERTLNEVLDRVIDYIDSEVFVQPDAESHIYGLDEVDRPDVSWYRPLMEDLIPNRGRIDTPRQGKSVLLTAAQERILFLKFNYARFRMRAVQIELDGRRPDLPAAREILRWHAIAESFR